MFIGLVSTDENIITQMNQYFETSGLEYNARIFKNTNELLEYTLHGRTVDLLFADADQVSPAAFAGLKDNCTYLVILGNDKGCAYDAYESGAIDFLLKPFPEKRFKETLKKIFFPSRRSPRRSRHTLTGNAYSYTWHKSSLNVVFLKSGYKIHKINLSEIRFLEKQGNYFILHEKAKRKIILRMNFQTILEFLPYPEFIRVHKSYIVALRHIEFIEGNEISIDNEKIPISSAYKESLLEMITLAD